MVIQFKFLMCFLMGVLCNSVLNAQYQLGMRLENSAGLNSLAINPSSILSSTSKWEIHLAGAGLFFENDYFFLKNTNLSRLFRHRNTASLVFEQNSNAPNVFEIDFAQGNQNRFFNTNLYVAGPGVAYKLSENQSIAVFSQLRSMVTSNKLPGDYSYYHITNRPLNQTFPIKPYKGALLNWMEIGISYAQKIQMADQNLDVGLSLKYLSGYDALSLRSKGTYEHTVINRNDFTMAGTDFSYLYSPVEALLSQVRGRGASLDIGVNYLISPKKSRNTWKIGASLTDIGLIKFTGISRLDYQSNDTLTVIGNDFSNTDISNGLDDVTDRFVQTVIGNSSDLTRRNNTNLFTPTTFIVHSDYQYNKNIFFNGLWAQSIQIFGSGPVNGSLLAFTPRWEDKWYSFSLPISLYQWQKLRVGLACRIGYFSIGSDNIGSIVRKNDFTGTDLYTSLKIPIGNFGNDFSFRRMGKKVKGSLECYPM
jgi:hypothetical protein